MPRRAAALVALLVAPAVQAQHAAPTGGADPRSELRALEAALTRAADGAARPNVFALQAGACRGYRIEGVGAVFVLPPRALRNALPGWRSRADRGGHASMAPQPDLDREIRLMQLQAEAFQREAARTQEEIERAVAAVGSEINRRQAEAAHPAATTTAPQAPDPPAAPPAPETALPPPPWTLWFEAIPQEDETETPAATVVARVRGALVDALSSHGVRLRALRSEETIAAVVDFVPTFPFGGARVERTLVVRVRKKDVDERQAGRIAADELKSRIEVAEY